MVFCQLTGLTIIQVLRYSALAAGVFYGLYHQASLTASAKLSAINKEYEHKQNLIDKAKAEYSKKHVPAEKKMESGDGTFKLSHLRTIGNWRYSRGSCALSQSLAEILCRSCD
jgi:F-type H+-transporting ATP synthase subunit e